MIDLSEETALWLHIAVNNTEILHQLNKKGKGNRFARFDDEGSIGTLSDLDPEIRLELRDGPVGHIQGNNNYMTDTMYRTVRVIGKYALNDFTAKAAMQQRAKAALVEAVRFLSGEYQGGRACNSKLLRMFDPSKITYELLDFATADSSTYCGMLMRVQFNCRIASTPALTYAPFVFPAP